MADDQAVSVRATGSPAAVERLITAIRDMGVHVTTRGPYQRNDGRAAFYAELRLPANTNQEGTTTRA